MAVRDEAGCPFCRIIDGSDADAQIVGEGEGWVAFFPLHPATRGHTLVVPRAHVRDFWEAGSAVTTDLAIACVAVGRALKDALEPEGMNLITSAGDAAEQTVFHLHLHVVPRWQGDAIDSIWPPDSESSEIASADLLREVRDVLAASQGD